MFHSSMLRIALLLACAGGPPFQELTLDQALAAARTEKKVVVVDFFTTWCPPCKQMDARTWSQKNVQDWVTARAVAIKVDADREKEIAQRYSVKAFPSVLFLTPDGVERDRLVGHREPADFLAAAEVILKGDGQVERVRTRLAGHESDPALRLEYAQALVGVARFDEALAEFTWCFDEGVRTATFASARRSSLLYDIAHLGESFPPAIRALEERRATAESALRGGTGTAEIARDYAALNRALLNPGRTTDVYEELLGDGHLGAELKEALLDDVVDVWTASRRYARIVQEIGDAGARFDAILAVQDSASRAAQIKAALERGAVSYEALVGTGNAAAANGIADRMIKVQPSSATFVVLIERALRAEAPTAARAIAERAYALLTESEQRRVRLAAKKIPEAK